MKPSRTKELVRLMAPSFRDARLTEGHESKSVPSMRKALMATLLRDVL